MEFRDGKHLLGGLMQGLVLIVYMQDNLLQMVVVMMDTHAICVILPLCTSMDQNFSFLWA